MNEISEEKPYVLDFYYKQEKSLQKKTIKKIYAEEDEDDLLEHRITL